jgi:NAD(P)-dependent dehydrogenase (short-subunit alcohol dehydrogenase family)
MDSLKDFIFKLVSRQTIEIVTNTTLSGKVAVITGASRGMGKTTSDVLLKQGASVVLVSRSISEKHTSPHVLSIKADITKESDCKKIITQTMKRFGKIDVIINNAGMFSGTALENTQLAEWRATTALNLESMFLMCKVALPVMKKQKNGLIVNIGSKISRKTNVTAHKVLYATTKYAVEGFSHALQNEVKQYGIRIVCLMPDTVNTHRTMKAAQYLSPYRIGQVIAAMITMDEVSFDNVVISSKYQTN